MISLTLRYLLPSDTDWDGVPVPPGLVSKTFVLDRSSQAYGGSYVFSDRASLDAFLASDLYRQAVARFGEPALLRVEEMAERAGADAREMLRHTVATLAYRGGKALRGAPEGFAGYRAGSGLRTPVEILAHLGDLLDWALSLADGGNAWSDSDPLPWNEGIARFYERLARLDRRIGPSGPPLACPPGRLFQGPIADALTHVGQIAMLRRQFGAPVRGENYFRAEIEAGRVGAEQAAPKVEFD